MIYFHIHTTGLNHPSDDDDDKLLLWYGSPTKDVALFSAGTTHHRPEILTIDNLRHAASRI